ncbi:hypothetical protein ADUPG1_005453, partial [Aduncisulcus paluster]
MLQWYKCVFKPLLECPALFSARQVMHKTLGRREEVWEMAGYGGMHREIPLSFLYSSSPLTHSLIPFHPIQTPMNMSQMIKYRSSQGFLSSHASSISLHGKRGAVGPIRLVLHLYPRTSSAAPIKTRPECIVLPL